MDVGYRSDCVVTACVGFGEWGEDAPAFDLLVQSKVPAAAYEPGQFWRRELPYLLDTLARFESPFEVVVVDGYVWLDKGRPGLGKYLFDALEGRSAVIGVGKTRFRAAEGVCAVFRGKSKVPLFVSTAGLPLADAVHAIENMAGPYRVPNLIRRVDRLSRS